MSLQTSQIQLGDPSALIRGGGGGLGDEFCGIRVGPGRAGPEGPDLHHNSCTQHLQKPRISQDGRRKMLENNPGIIQTPFPACSFGNQTHFLSNAEYGRRNSDSEEVLIQKLF